LFMVLGITYLFAYQYQQRDSRLAAYFLTSFHLLAYFFL
jgi:hypothetical protein